MFGYASLAIDPRRERHMSMDWFVSSSMYWLPVLGILSVVMTRMSYQGWRETLCQRLCLAFVVVLGISTVAAIGFSSHHWVGLAASLSIVSIGSTMQVRPE